MMEVINRECEKKFNKSGREMGLNLVRFNGKQGILRCNHIEKEKVINLLNSLNTILSREIKIETLGTSGTIKSLVKKHMKDINFYKNNEN